MLYDIRVRPEQLEKLAAWAQTGKDMADVELVVDDSMLLAEQGDERAAWDYDGSEAGNEYLAKAPLDPSPQNALLRDLATTLWPEKFPPGHPWHPEDHMYWNSGMYGDWHEGAPFAPPPFQWSAETIEWVAAMVAERMPEGWEPTP